MKSCEIEGIEGVQGTAWTTAALGPLGFQLTQSQNDLIRIEGGDDDRHPLNEKQVSYQGAANTGNESWRRLGC
jgi:hypothetical protein